MKAINLLEYLEELIQKSNDKTEIEITVNGCEIDKIVYEVSLDSNEIRDEAINIIAG